MSTKIFYAVEYFVPGDDMPRWSAKSTNEQAQNKAAIMEYVFGWQATVYWFEE